MPKPTIELVGLAEIAEMAGVSHQQVHNWTRRSKDMPPAHRPAQMRPDLAWDGSAREHQERAPVHRSLLAEMDWQK